MPISIHRAALGARDNFQVWLPLLVALVLTAVFLASAAWEAPGAEPAQVAQLGP
ncbi:MAG TPA: hypothetical protein VFE30_17335 [Anaeromyxobacteraceae bacterium]|jgi:hypothetical protein|nr:hypothetical protein [Anaeromyxobacteraceae bacterium]